jgi:hypothetical protein
MPSARVMTANAVKPGDCRSLRKAKRMSVNMDLRGWGVACVWTPHTIQPSRS